MNIKIQNLNQLKKNISLALSNQISPSYIFSGKLTFTFEISEKINIFADNAKFKMIMPQAKKPRYIDFENENEEIAFFYDCQEAVITVCHEDRNLNTEHMLLDDEGFAPLSKSDVQTEISENNNAEYTFLTLSGFDLSNGYWSEDYEEVKAKNSELHFAVFGY